MTIRLTSETFKQNQPIPARHTEDGEDVSPPLRWSGVPAEARQFALIMDDPDAPRPEPWVHWVIYGIPAEVAALPPGVPRSERLAEPAGALQGKNTSGESGYRGPAPPRGHGRHRYHFRLYALDEALELAPG
ncbi:MAG: YbhB/YbcL family Raf kinase inhibitor-like protein, partial [Planctomycetales bacterium]